MTTIDKVEVEDKVYNLLENTKGRVVKVDREQCKISVLDKKHSILYEKCSLNRWYKIEEGVWVVVPTLKETECKLKKNENIRESLGDYFKAWRKGK